MHQHNAAVVTLANNDPNMTFAAHDVTSAKIGKRSGSSKAPPIPGLQNFLPY